MSQPPPPPGNPPVSGASAGAVPPPPQAPPGPPGYGYPPPAPTPAGLAQPPVPPGQNPYAAPVPPGQNPYATPPGAYPGGSRPPQGGQPHPVQQPYGYGPQPPAPGPYGTPAPGPYGTPAPYQQPPNGGRPPAGRNKAAAVVAAVLAAVLVIAGGVYLATKGGGSGKPGPQASSQHPGSGTPTAPTHKATLSFAWEKAAVPAGKDLRDALGFWLAGTYAVKNEINKVVAYDQATGAVAWTVPAPARGDCTAARDTYHNLAAIQFGADCGQIMVIDLLAGKPVWTARLPGGTGGPTDFDFTQMAISGDALGVDWLDGSIGYRLTTHQVLWRSGNGTCEDDGYAGGKQFVAIVNCDETTYKVQVVDPEHNGNAKWTWQAPVNTQVSAVVSTDPVVVLLGTAGRPYTDVVTLAGGRLQSRISLGTDKYDINEDGTDVQSVHNVIVSADTVYLTLSSRTDGNGQVLSGIVAFNTSDGKQRWVSKPGGKQDITGLALQDGKLLAYVPPGYEVPGRLVALDPATGAITPYAAFSADAYDRLGLPGLHTYPVWFGGRFYWVLTTVYASGSKYVVAYG